MKPDKILGLPRMRYAACFPMLLDGDPDFLRSLLETVRRSGVPGQQISTFGSAKEAISSLEAGGVRGPSVALIDAQLPRGGGLELLEWLRRSGTWGALPVFMFSSHWDAALIARSLDLKVMSFFLKPSNGSDLEPIIEGILAHWFRHSSGAIA